MSPVPPDKKPRLRRPCPRCHCGLRRVQRTARDKLMALIRPRVGRYRCVAKGCGWEGTLQRRSRRTAASLLASVFSSGRQMAKGIGVAASLAGMALAAGLAIEHLQPEQEAVLVGQHRVVRGFSHDGDKLPADHPLMLASSSIGDTDEVEPARPAAPAGAAAASSPGGAPEEPLMLRRHCSWGVPGRNPYKGSVELALRTARLPETVVHQIAADMRDKKPIDRVSITNGSIRADSSGRRFDASKVAMTYGRSLCVDTRVNFKKNHVERADLYEATDAKGNVVAVMVPDVCGNVSVLSEVAEADDLHGANAAGREGRNATMRRLPQALVYDAGSGRSRLASVVGPANAVSSPGTLGCLLAAALAALLHSHRRSRVKPALGR